MCPINPQKETKRRGFFELVCYEAPRQIRVDIWSERLGIDREGLKEIYL